MAEDRIELTKSRTAEDFAGEALHEDAIDAVIAHPLEMAQDCLGVEGAVDFGGFAVGELERGGVAFVGVEFADIGPEIDVGAAGLEAALAGPVVPSAAEAIAFRRVPALIAAHDFALESGAIDAFFAFACEGL